MDQSQEFDLTTTYLNTASHGLLPARSLAELRRGAERMADGTLDQAACFAVVEEARATFGRLVGLPAGRVAVGSTVAVHVALIAGSLPPGAEVLIARDEFSSLPTPFDQRGDLRLRQAPLAELAGAVTAGTALVVVSAAQSADGAVADLAAVSAAARAHGARTLVDTTQSTGWLPLDAGDFDYTVCGAYKWLLCPRGTSFLTVPEDFGGLRALHAGWVAGEDPWRSCYGPVTELAHSARRFDESPAFLSYLGAAPALRLIEELGQEAIGAHDRALAARFRAGLSQLGHPVPDSGGPVVSVPGLGPLTAELARAGVQAADRAGRLRIALHLYNTEADVDRALEVLESHRPA
ncbi:aminotransferase class V-fold PLP-dependent enzyme [Streptomyces otsuchiensis]|uniref:aminotransferase class V-fold PLP-dependent enzyme n=1 Tax=Streptomyces otsuchiensis TaxID=2681388 RepID=UPI0010315268|nr:aminotransferase class V-fold PLP-dependent enzyme [Streptomyces otsuchiensis]